MPKDFEIRPANDGEHIAGIFCRKCGESKQWVGAQIAQKYGLTDGSLRLIQNYKRGDRVLYVGFRYPDIFKKEGYVLAVSIEHNLMVIQFDDGVGGYDLFVHPNDVRADLVMERLNQRLKERRSQGQKAETEQDSDV